MGRDESQGCDGTGDVEEVAEVPKANDSALADATDVDTIRSKLWELQRLLNNRKGQALKDQDRLQDELEFTCEGMVAVSKEFTNCWDLHDAACANVNNTSAKLSGAFREVGNRRATHEATCAEGKKASQRAAESHGSAGENELPQRAFQENSQRAHKIRSSFEQQLGIQGQVRKRISASHPPAHVWRPRS